MEKFTLKGLVITGLILFHTFNSISQNNQFSKTYGGFANDEGHDIISLPDGGFLLTGANGSLGDTLFDAYILRLDSIGNIVWQRTFGDYDQDGGNEMLPTPDGNFFIVGHSERRGKDCDAYYLLINQQGDTLWTRTYGFSGDDVAYSCTMAPDGNYFAVGVVAIENRQGDAFLQKINPLGEILWTKQYGGIEEDYFNQIRPTPDGNFLVSGKITKNGNSDFWLMKLDSLGNVLWEKNYGTDDLEIPYGLKITSDGGCLMVGKAESTTNDSASALFFVRVDSIGNLLWSKKLPDAKAYTAYAALLTPDSAWISCGETYNTENHSMDAFLMKMDDNGNILWKKNFGGAKDDNAEGLSFCDNGDIIFTGYTRSSGAGQEDVFVVRTSANGDIISGIPEISSKDFLSIQPNPFSSYTVIRFPAGLSGGEITIYDMSGRIIQKTKEVQQGMVKLEKNALAAGIYMVRLTDNNSVIQTKKLVAE